MLPVIFYVLIVLLLSPFEQPLHGIYISITRQLTASPVRKARKEGYTAASSDREGRAGVKLLAHR